MTEKANVFAYEYKNNIYINLTNACTNDCDFCVRNNKDGVGEDVLWLKHEPTVDEIIKQLEEHDVDKCSEIVYCGYGEPTMRLDALLESAKIIKNKYNKKIRINTNGQANMFFKEDITPRLEGLIDVVSISLNHSDASNYDAICHSIYGKDAFQGILDFAVLCKEHVPYVRLTIVDLLPLKDQKKCQLIADSIGIELYIRKMIE